VISDNGIGFNAKGKKKGIGIQNMLSRTKSAMANFRLIQKKERHNYHIIVPIEQKLIPP
jgi:signal transduction histidine kinase